MNELTARAANAIDTEWHSSWHWEKDAAGRLTDKGLEKAIADGESRCEEVIDKLCELRAVLTDLYAELERRSEQ